jgi:hypothetical protein
MQRPWNPHDGAAVHSIGREYKADADPPPILVIV